MDKRLLLGFTLLILVISIKSTTTKANEDNNVREQRGLFLNTLTAGSNFYTLFQNYTAAKLLQSTTLLTTLLNATGTNLFATKKIALLSTLANATADLIAAKTNFTNAKLLSKLVLLTNSTTLGLKAALNTSSVFFTNLYNAKLNLTNATLTAKLQFWNASTLALGSALAAKVNKTALLLNATSLAGKKNFSLLLDDALADTFIELHNLTTLDNGGLFNKTNKKYKDEYEHQVEDPEDNQIRYNFEYV